MLYRYRFPQRHNIWLCLKLLLPDVTLSQRLTRSSFFDLFYFLIYIDTKRKYDYLIIHMSCKIEKYQTIDTLRYRRYNNEKHQ